MYAEIKRLTRKCAPRFNVIKSQDDRVLTESEDILERWREYCSQLYTDEQNDNLQERDSELTEDSDLIPIRSEVEQAMKHLKRGKSPQFQLSYCWQEVRLQSH